MTISHRDLVAHFADSLHRGDAALFAGAGLSRASGFVDWRELLRGCCSELGLEVEKEHDLVAVAQYYINEHLLDRSRLNQVLVNEFSQDAELSENHRIIARLPVRTVWTTNYDKLLEAAYADAGRSLDVKTTDRSIGTSRPEREVVLYKMHGDIACPEETVICRDDYEKYARTHPIFQNLLQGHLTSKTFLFVGFGFADPNLDYMLGRIRALLGESKREHYAIMRVAQRGDYSKDTAGKAKYDYESRQQELRLKDLERYSIKTATIAEYDDVTKLLHAISRSYKRRNVFVSGSAREFGEFGEERLKGLCSRLGRQLMERHYNLTCGFGAGVGSAVAMGALEELYQRETENIERRVRFRPFPHKQLSGERRHQFSTLHRQKMLADCGFAVFVAGNKPGYTESPGVLEEWKIAEQQGCVPVPIGATGFAAKHIWENVRKCLPEVYGRRLHGTIYETIGRAAATDDEIAQAVFEIMRHVETGTA